MVRSFFALAIVAGAFLISLAGCGEANPLGRRAIHGRVSYQGKPVDYGAIQFTPADLQRGVNSGAMIENGQYSIKLAEGLPPGEYKVMVSAPDRGQKERVEGAPGDERSLAVERIPAKYNLKTTLTLQVPKGRGRHEANFELQ